MLAYVISEDQIYQFQIPNYYNLWTGATSAMGPGGPTAIFSDFGTTIKSNSSEGISFISAWTANTIDGVSGETSATASWKKFNPASSLTGVCYNQIITKELIGCDISGITLSSDLIPISDDSINLGTSIRRFRNINTVSGTSSYWTATVKVITPEVELGMGPDDFANLAARALEPKLPDIISVAHIHAARVSVREQAAIIVERLRRVGQASFRTLTRDCDTTLLVVARFLALLEIYRDGLVTFDQPTPLGELYVRWIGDDDLDANSLREIDEFDTTEVQDFRTQLGDVEASEQVDDEIGDQPNE